MQPNSKTSLRVGLFVSAALALIAILAFVVGAQQNLFTRKRGSSCGNASSTSA